MCIEDPDSTRAHAKQDGVLIVDIASCGSIQRRFALPGHAYCVKLGVRYTRVIVKYFLIQSATTAVDKKKVLSRMTVALRLEAQVVGGPLDTL